MPDSTLNLNCPTCAQQVTVFSTKLDITKPIFCGRCRTYTNIPDLKTDSGKTLFEHSAQAIRDGLPVYGRLTSRR